MGNKRQDPRQDKTRQDKARQGKARRDTARGSKTDHCPPIAEQKVQMHWSDDGPGVRGGGVGVGVGVGVGGGFM